MNLKIKLEQDGSIASGFLVGLKWNWSKPRCDNFIISGNVRYYCAALHSKRIHFACILV